MATVLRILDHTDIVRQRGSPLISIAAPRGPPSGAQLTPRSTPSKRRDDGPDTQAGKAASPPRAIPGEQLAALDNPAYYGFAE
jgi:hypothetical protein